MKAFAAMDLDADGRLSLEEFSQGLGLLRRAGEEDSAWMMTPEETKALFRRFDRDASGSVEIGEFVHLAVAQGLLVSAAAASSALPPGKPPLPAGWEVFTDKGSGKPYYHEAATGKTQWDHPAEEQTAAPGESGEAAAAEAPGMPEGWEQVLDVRSGKVYYHHVATGKTQWEHPAGAEGHDDE